MARSAAIFGVASFDSADQPACSRRLTKCTFALVPAASSPNNGASCVQPTITSSAWPSAAWNAPASLRQSWWWSESGAPALSAAPSAAASIATVRLQLQTLSVFPSTVIAFRFFLWRWRRAVPFFGDPLFVFLLLRVIEEQRARLIERRQHLLRDRLAAGPVARERLVRVGHVEMGIAEQLLQRRAAQRVLDLRMHE